MKVSWSKKKRNILKTKATAILPKQVRENLSIPRAAGKLATKTQWDTKRTLKRNYEDNKVVSDANASIGMDIDEGGSHSESKKTEKNKVEMLPLDVVDEINATFGLQRSTGRRPPKRLTTVQIKVVGKLIEKHGKDNIAAMAKDIKLNKMQHSQGVLKKMVESYYAYPNLINGEGRRDFHSVQKMK